MDPLRALQFLLSEGYKPDMADKVLKELQRTGTVDPFNPIADHAAITQGGAAVGAGGKDQARLPQGVPGTLDHTKGQMGALMAQPVGNDVGGRAEALAKLFSQANAQRAGESMAAAAPPPKTRSIGAKPQTQVADTGGTVPNVADNTSSGNSPMLNRGPSNAANPPAPPLPPPVDVAVAPVAAAPPPPAGNPMMGDWNPMMGTGAAGGGNLGAGLGMLASALMSEPQQKPPPLLNPTAAKMNPGGLNAEMANAGPQQPQAAAIPPIGTLGAMKAALNDNDREANREQLKAFFSRVFA